MSSQTNISKKEKSPSPTEKPPKSGKSLEVLHIVLFFLALILTLSLIWFNPYEGPGAAGGSSGPLGQVGNYLAGFVINITFGRWGAFSVPAALFLLLTGWWSGGRFKPLRWIFAVLLIGLYTGLVIALVNLAQNGLPSVDQSGLPALALVEFGTAHLKLVGTSLILLALAFIFAVLLADLRPSILFSNVFYTFPKTIFRAVGSISKSRQKSGSLPAGKELETRTEKDDYYAEDTAEAEEIDYSSAADEGLDAAKSAAQKGAASPSAGFRLPISFQKSLAPQATATAGERSLPPLDLLDEPPAGRPAVPQSELDNNSRRLEDKLANLGIQAKVIRTLPGPVITRYDLEPAAEVKIARIANLADDIAMALKAPAVRILAPIPGEAAVGIEIPNRHPAMVYMREVVASEDFRRAENPLTIALGKDAGGHIFCTDLARMPHLLIAGATGSGKSVCINAIIASLLYRSDPEAVRLVLIDPKKLELSLYARLAAHHLVSPPGLGEEVITSPENAVKTLQSVHAEMMRRYDVLSEAGVRGLVDYNRWLQSSAPSGEGEIDIRERLPYLVVIIDELADLMMVVRREFEELVARLAQMSRAVGIHLVVATQRPSVDVVTGLIKANFPSRIAFQVASKVDSRTIIDGMGAESLLGRGDMLFQGPGAARLVRLHGALITTEEVEHIVEWTRAQPPCRSAFKLPDPESSAVHIKSAGEPEGETAGVDEFFEEAAKIVVRTEQGSISVLQRRLRVGYARAARLIDQLEQAGIVGPFDGSKAREVLVTVEDLKERYGIE